MIVLISFFKFNFIFLNLDQPEILILNYQDVQFIRNLISCKNKEINVCK